MEHDITIMKLTPYDDPKSSIVAFCDVIVNGIAIKGIMVVIENEDGKLVTNVRFPNRVLKNGSLKKIAFPVSTELYVALKNMIRDEYLYIMEGINNE